MKYLGVLGLCVIAVANGVSTVDGDDWRFWLFLLGCSILGTLWKDSPKKSEETK